MPEVLDKNTIQQQIEDLDGWELEDNSITRTFEFQDFVTAMEFVNKLVEPAEAMQHHPDIEISYNTVRLSLTTHSEGGVTDNDFQLAGKINTLV